MKFVINNLKKDEIQKGLYSERVKIEITMYPVKVSRYTNAKILHLRSWWSKK